MAKKEYRLLDLFEVVQPKDEKLIKGKWKRVPEEDVGVTITRLNMSMYRRLQIIEHEED